MQPRTRVYKLSQITDDPRFAGFGHEGSLPSPSSPDRRTRDWRPRRLTSTWTPVRVVGRVRKYHDYPCVLGWPTFSERAVDALRDFLEPNGELLPLDSEQGSYFLYNVTTVVDVLNLRESEITWNPKPIRAMFIDRYEFYVDKLEGLSIFKIVENSAHVYVTEPFVRRAHEHSLQGMDFEIVWPLPPGVSWREVSKAGWKDRATTFKGNTVVLRLGLSGEKPTVTERKRVEALEDQLDAILFAADSKEAAIGNVEGFDNGASGECRVFLSCPNADALVKFLRPRLRELRWPGNMSLLKRFGQYMDPTAREEPVGL